SGTLLIEAVLIAADIAPGLARNYFGFSGWKGHDAKLWEALLSDAVRRKQNGAAHIPRITGYDIDPRALQNAADNIRNAGLESWIQVERGSITAIMAPSVDQAPGLIAVNPPYGERMDAQRGVETLYSEFGSLLKSRFIGWRVAMLIADAELGFRVGIRSRRPATLYNGPIECKLLLFTVEPESFFQPKDLKSEHRKHSPEPDSPLARARNLANSSEARAAMFQNRLRKNMRNLGKWANRERISCFRLYDADLPEYALAIDLYRGSSEWAHVQEYQAPSTIDPDKAQARLVDALCVIPGVLGIEWPNLFFKVRRRQKGTNQYMRHEDSGNFHEIDEAGHRFFVNFESYLDTGLFLDQRMTRARIKQLARGRRFLNLFGYTGTATVYAAAGGATATTTVDLSRTYLDWASRNLALNGFNTPAHRLIPSDAIDWIDQTTVKRGLDDRFALIFLDPPTFSNSKSMDRVFDIQRDHVDLIERTCRLLAPKGLLIFSTNYRKFRLETERLANLQLVDINRKTLPRDFERNPGIHQCFEIRRS
ncbi:MAG: bifunctional 23S rRNA (guanine(2069)-N(7))-methyltransferase RlmK/23S rRNA (guanine(2445)-N(2))-methyltransferase RlmL, partial [Methylococcales bacterium]